MQAKRKISGAGWVVIGIVGLLGLGLAVLFGYQTWQLVDWLLPSDVTLMKILAVISFDGFSYLWLAAALVLRDFFKKGAIQWCQWVGGFDFALSLICSFVQMEIAESERYLFSIPVLLVYFANTLIILSIVANLGCIIALLHIQWSAIAGEEAEQAPRVALTASDVAFLKAMANNELSGGPATDPLALRPPINQANGKGKGH